MKNIREKKLNWKIAGTAALLTLAFSLSARSSEMWVTYPELTTKEKLKKATENSSQSFKDVNLISMQEGLIAHPVSSSELQKLLTLEESAQKNELNGQFKESLAKYAKLLKKLEEIPNVSGIEKITFEAKIRSAELSSLMKDSSKDKLWQNAHSWSPKANLSRDHYSPFIIGQFRKLNYRRPLVNLKVIAPLESFVFIDGRKMKFENEQWSAELEEGEHQVSSLSPGALWGVRKILVKTDSKPIEIKFEPVPAIVGSCESPKFTAENFKWDSKILVLFENGSCERVFDGTRWYSPKGEVINASGLPRLEGGGINMGYAAPEKKVWYESLVKSPWFWVGTGVVIAGAVTYMREHDRQDTVLVPTKN